MTQEEKDLLIKYLCSALPYGVIVSTPKGDGHLCSINQTIFGNEYGVNISAVSRDYFKDDKDVIKPYLRSMESMSEEEKAEYYDCIFNSHLDLELDWLLTNHFDLIGLIPMGLAIEVAENNNPYKD